ncbi:MAG: multidrug effflux MFS transporter [Actinomycetaceae bacterium]|nr:multidrug effflux MFS transporter [Actinomycetaceae bacterium]
MNSGEDLSVSEQRRAAGVTTTLLAALAIQNAVPPFATDMYAPAFPAVTEDLHTDAALIGLTLTAFFIAFGAGQVMAGAASDRVGRRLPILLGGVIALIGSALCAVAPSIWVLMVGRFLQGFGGGAASAVGRAVLVDVARGRLLASTMSILQALGGLAPMVAPVAGAWVLTWGSWRDIFWFLTVFCVLMLVSAFIWIPETLPVEKRDMETNPAVQFFNGFVAIMRVRSYVSLMLASSLVFFCLFGYVANSSYILQETLGVSPVEYSLIFAGNALLSTLGAVANTRLLHYFSPRRLIATGLVGSCISVVILVVSIIVMTPTLIPVCIGFALLLTSISVVFGNAAALSLESVREWAGTASAVQGLGVAIAASISAPLATMGGETNPDPMVWVMVFGIVCAVVAFMIGGTKPTPKAALPEV